MRHPTSAACLTVAFRALVCLSLTAATSVPLAAQRIAVETLTDIEFWKTDDSSRLVARNAGQALVAGRVHAWVVARLAQSLELRALGRLDASSEEGVGLTAWLDGASLRYARSRALVLEAGKVLYPMGAFGARRFSNTNPLIGAPDLYPYQYPLGIVLSGAAGSVDYRAGLVSLPLVNTEYTPEPGAKARPVVGVGVSAGPSFRMGASATRGAYLSERVEPQLPAGSTWDGFSQAIVATDARYSAGYVEVRAEAAWSSYEAPLAKQPIKGFGWYGELKTTLSPRLFAAVRYEDFDYPFILPVSKTFWVVRATRQMNGELGVGYRLTADALIKTSFRKDHWPVHTLPNGMRFKDGYAFGVQFSLHTDISALIEGKY